jgi:hypothetical protein
MQCWSWGRKTRKASEREALRQGTQGREISKLLTCCKFLPGFCSQSWEPNYQGQCNKLDLATYKVQPSGPKLKNGWEKGGILQ